MLLSNLLNPTLDYYQQGETSLSADPRKQNVPGIFSMGSCWDRLSQTRSLKLVNYCRPDHISNLNDLGLHASHSCEKRFALVVHKAAIVWWAAREKKRAM